MIFTYLDIYFSLLPVIAYLIHWKNAKTELGIKLIVFYSFIFFAVNFLMLNWKLMPILYDLITLVEFLVFSSFLFFQLENATAKKIIRNLRVVFTCCFVVFAIYTKTALNLSSIPSNSVMIDSIPIAVETIIILPFAFFFLYERTNDTTTLFIYNTYQFWIVLGLVLYLAGSFFIYIFTNYLSLADVRKYWVITNIFSVLRSCFFVLAISLHAKPTKNVLVTDYEMTYLN